MTGTLDVWWDGRLVGALQTSESYVARLEGGKVRPSTDALERFARATGTRLRISFEPVGDTA